MLAAHVMFLTNAMVINIKSMGIAPGHLVSLTRALTIDGGQNKKVSEQLGDLPDGARDEANQHLHNQMCMFADQGSQLVEIIDRASLIADAR